MADIPVDLYFVMDSSESMRKVAKKLAAASYDIADKIQDLTSHVRFGIGSFSEKPVIPYSKNSELYEQNEKKPYIFHHDMSLNNSIDEFKKKIEELLEGFHNNIDIPEAGLYQI